MRQLTKIIGILVILFVNDSLSQIIPFPDGSCLTPSRLHGLCINIVDCASLLEVLKNVNRSPLETQNLQNSQCGTKDGATLVCCRIKVKSTPQPVTNSDLLPNIRQCGRSFDNKIYGGENTKIDEYPWTALIEYTNPDNVKSHNCGASLINNRYVVTAAHCIKGSAITSMNLNISGIRLGEWDRSRNPDFQVYTNGKIDWADPYLDVGIEQIISHENYSLDDPNNLNDIALIRMNQEIHFTDFISPVCLPVQSHLRSKTFENIKMDVTGWGITEDGSTSTIKLKAAVDGFPFDKCSLRYASKRKYLQNTQMCAGGKEGVDSCSGDSGGPLVVKEKLDNRDVYVLSGIVSFGPIQCGLIGWPGVYTRVGAYIDWITNNIKA